MRIGWYSRLGRCKSRRGNIDLRGDRSMEVQEYDTRHVQYAAYSTREVEGTLDDVGDMDRPGTGQ